MPKLKFNYTLWERQPKNREELRRYCSNIPNIYGSGFITQAGLPVNFVVDSLIVHIWENFFFTGNQDKECEGIVDSPVDLSRWQKARLPWHNHRGPTWECGPLSVLVVGLLAALGVFARRVWNSRMTDGQVDYAIEYWHPLWKCWVFVIPQLCLSFEGQGGKRLDLYTSSKMDRAGEKTIPVALRGSGDVKYPQDNTIQWHQYVDMSGGPYVMGTNWHCAGGGDSLQKPHWFHYQLMPLLGKGVGFDPEYAVSFVTFDVQDLLAEPHL